MLAPVQIDTPKTGDTTAAFFGAYILFILMYMVIMLYGMNTARSIIEEKSSRVFEVLLSTIRPEEMLAGKIIGVGSVGLTQVGVWMLGALSVGVYFAGSMPGSGGHAVVSPSQVFFFIAYFLFGFLLYSSVAAALGSMTNSEQELQQLNMFLVIPLGFCMVMLFSVIKSPDSTLSPRGLAHSLLQPAPDELPHLHRRPAAVGDLAQLPPDEPHHRRHPLGVQPYLPRRHPHVRQKTQPAGDPALAQVQLNHFVARIGWPTGNAR